MSHSIQWNNSVKLIISDVDETIADLYTDASTDICKELESILSEGKILFLVSGQSITNIHQRVCRHIKSSLRKGIIIGHCSGAEVYGYDAKGNVNKKPFYSMYDSLMDKKQGQEWRKIMAQLIREFKLKKYDTMRIPEFKKKAGDNPLAIMYEDRKVQITMEFVNGYNIPRNKLLSVGRYVPIVMNCFDLRLPVKDRAELLLQRKKLPITPRLAGVFALDFAIEDVSKTTAVKFMLENNSILTKLGLSKDILEHPELIEVWGDKFSAINGGTDRHISEALPREVRSIDFRLENPQEFLRDYNIVVWHGEHHLHHGLLEYLKARKS
jgi:hydroxymethylpyrimidine pyrophosphatase-like HAD family hydrolase